MVREHVGDRFAAVLDAVEEVLHVPAAFLALVQSAISLANVFSITRLIKSLLSGSLPLLPFFLLDFGLDGAHSSSIGSPLIRAAVDEDLALVAFEPDAVVRAVLDVDRRAVGELQVDVELGGRVVAVGQLAACPRRTPPDRSRPGCSGSRLGLRSRPAPWTPGPVPNGRCRRDGRPSRSACRRSTPATSGSCRGSVPWCRAPRGTGPARSPNPGWPAVRPSANGPPDGAPPIEQVALSVLPSRPLRAMAMASRKRPSLRCCVPTWNTRFVCLDHLADPACLRRSSGSAASRSTRPCRPAGPRWRSSTCQWSGVPIVTTSTSLRSSTLR